MESTLRGIVWFCAVLHSAQFSVSQESAGCKKATLPIISGPGSVTPTQEVYKIGDEVKIVCNDGFQLAAGIEVKSTCRNTGFQPSAFECVELESGCPKSSLPTIEGKGNFDQIKETYDFGEVVTIICNEKYEIKDESQSTCKKETSTFSPNTIVCQEIQEVTCSKDNLPKIDGPGSVTPVQEKYEIGEEVEINCDEGFKLPTNVKSSKCGQNGFQPNNFQCVEDDTGCDAGDLPSVIGNGFVAPMQVFYSEGDEVEVVCGRNLVIVGNLTSVCKCGNFIPPVLVCGEEEEEETDCYEPPKVIGNGYLDPEQESYKEGEKIKLICKEGIINGEDHSTCSNGYFSPAKLVCSDEDKETDCYEPPKLIGNGYLDPEQESYKEGEKVKLICKEGIINGEDHSTCSNGYFSPAKLVCSDQDKESVCYESDLPMIKGRGELEPIQKTYEEGEKVELICDENFIYGEHNHSTCMDGKFHPYYLECFTTHSGCHSSSLPDVEGPGEVRPWKRFYEETEMVKLLCNDGYEPYEDEYAICIDNQFQPQQLKCVKSDYACYGEDLPEVVGAGEVGPYKESYDMNDVVILHCKEGYEPAGQDYAICGKQGFCPSSLECLEKAAIDGCGQDLLPDVIGKGELTPIQDIYEEGEVVTLECHDGFHSSHIQHSTCVNGDFVPRRLECYQNVEGCSRLPQVVGRGWLTPKKEFYADGEVVTMKCKVGYEAVDGEIHSVCVNQQFQPSALECAQQESSGCTNLPRIKGPGQFTPVKSEYADQDEITFKCAEGYTSMKQRTTAVCQKTIFRPTYFACTKSGGVCKDTSSKCSWAAQKGLCSKRRWKKCCKKTCKVCN